MPDELTGRRVVLRPIARADLETVRRIRTEADVTRWWGPIDPEPWPLENDPDSVRWAITVDGAVVGLIQHGEERDPQYRHADLDIFVSAGRSGQGYGRDAISTLARHLFVLGHHRIVIDPAADNARAIAAYAAVGFKPVGLMRRYERDADGAGWHDGMLMDLLVGELSAEPPPVSSAPAPGGRARPAG